MYIYIQYFNKKINIYLAKKLSCLIYIYYLGVVKVFHLRFGICHAWSFTLYNQVTLLDTIYCSGVNILSSRVQCDKYCKTTYLGYYVFELGRQYIFKVCVKADDHKNVHTAHSLYQIFYKIYETCIIW